MVREAYPLLSAALLAVVSASPALAQSERVVPKSQPSATTYPKLVMVDTDDGEVEPANWPRTGDHEWIARPGDPASPLHRMLFHKTRAFSPQQAIAIASQALAIKPTNVAVAELETYPLVYDGVRSWTVAADARKGGVDQSLFMWIYYDEGKSQYETAIFLMPTASYRSWGGVAQIIEFAKLSKYMKDFAKFRRLAPVASNEQQAQAFALAFDRGYHLTRMSMGGTSNGAEGALATLQAIGRDLNTRAECTMTEGCNYSQLGGPGTGSMSYDPR